MEKSRTIAVFGLGNFGYEVCRVLADKGAQVIAVDNQEKLVNKIKNIVAQSILIDSTDIEGLRNAGLDTIDVAIVAIGENSIDSSILTTALLKNLGISVIIARAISEVHAQVLRQVGATEVINIEVDEGRRIATRLIAPDILDIIPISKNQTLAEVRVPKSLVGKSILQLNFRKTFNLNVISIKKVKISIDDQGNPVQEETVLNPLPADILQIDDILVVVGHDKDIERVKEL
jgi:trk system potassium uptake protein